MVPEEKIRVRTLSGRRGIRQWSAASGCFEILLMVPQVGYIVKYLEAQYYPGVSNVYKAPLKFNWGLSNQDLGNEYMLIDSSTWEPRAPAGSSTRGNFEKVKKYL